MKNFILEDAARPGRCVILFGIRVRVRVRVGVIRVGAGVILTLPLTPPLTLPLTLPLTRSSEQGYIRARLLRAHDRDAG